MSLNLRPNPHKNWWCYVNHYVQGHGQKDASIQADVAAACFSRDSCLSKHDDDFDQPVVLTCYQPTENPGIYGEKQCFLHVYGVRKTVHLAFEDVAPDDWFYKKTQHAVLAYMQSNGLPCVRDLKLVYKRPYKSACVGSRLFLKLYLNGSVSRKILKDNLQSMRQTEMTCLDKGTLHGIALGQETQWFNAKRAFTVGRLKTTRPVRVLEKPNYFEAQVHHEDVVFDNLEEVDSPFDPCMSVSDVFETMVNSIVLPVMQQYANTAAQNVLRHDISRAKRLFCTLLGPGVKWTWLKLKEAFLRSIFEWVLTYKQDTSWKSHVKRHGGYLKNESISVNGVKLKEAIQIVYYHMLQVAYEVKADLKVFWRDRVLKPTEEKRNSYITSLTRSISEKKRWLVFDIETDHRPHEIKEESIIVISAVLFDHAHPDALEYVLFFRMPPNIKGDEYSKACKAVPGEKVVDLIKSQYADEKYADMVSGKNFHMVFSATEKQLLDQFRQYACKSQCSFVGYFNGHKFDLPFITNRQAVHAARTESDRSDIVLKKTTPQTFPYSFSYKPDEGRIRYEPPSKSHVHRKYSVQVWTDRVLAGRKRQKEDRKKERGEKRYNQLYTGKTYEKDELESSSDENDCSEESVPEPVSANTNGKFQAFLGAVRKIVSVGMTHVTLVDVMQHVGENKHGCKLDVAARKLLGYNKYDDEEVSYDNLCRTWMEGDKIKLAAYAMIDTLLTMNLVTVKKLNAFHLTLCEIIGLPEREIYLDESVRRLISVADRLGYYENLLTPDTSNVRDEKYPWIPDCPWDTERDYIHLRPPGGSTVPDVFGIYYVPCATLDFKSQYPSIMAGYNTCLTSLIELKDIRRLGLVEGKDYICVTLENSRPLVPHVCAKRGKVCSGDINGKGDPKLCKFEVEYVIVKYYAYFVTESYYKSVLNRSSRNMGAARTMYKRMRDEAKKTNDMVSWQVYELYQLAVKTVDNSTYGGTMRFNGIVGDAITNIGRTQARRLAELAAEKKMAIMNGDTDSVFIQIMPDPKDCENFGAMARFYGMDPRTTTVTDLVDKWFTVAKEFTDEVNNGCPKKGTGPLYPKPCFLELEKVFPFLCNFAKKNYGGDKILPNLEVCAHRSGMSGKKSDTTVVKTSSQFVGIKMLGRRDFDGLFAFSRDLFDFASWELRHQEKKNTQISAMCSEIPEDNMNSPAAEEARKKIKELKESECDRQVNKVCLIPLDWLESSEKVGDVDEPKTIATRRAIEICKYRGEDRHNAPSKVQVCRSSSVQVTAGLLKTLTTFLTAPSPEGFDEERDVRYKATNNEDKWKKRLRDKRTAAEKKLKEAQTVTKLNVTAMPFKWRVKPEIKYAATNKEREKAEVLKDYIIDMTKALDTERSEGFVDPPLPSPSIFEPEYAAVMERTQKRLHMYISEYTSCDRFPPLYLLSPDMAVSRLEHLRSDNCLPKRNTCCDIWELYISDMIDKCLRFVTVWWTSDGVKLDFHATRPKSDSLVAFTPEHCSWKAEEVYCLNSCDNKFVLDMEEYRQQTQTTPYIASTYDGQDTFLVNRDSYVSNKKNSFGFEVSIRKMLEVLEVMDEDGILIVNNIAETDRVELEEKRTKKSVTVAVTKVLRDDNRPVPVWRWKENGFELQTAALKQTLEKLAHRKSVPAKTASITLDREKEVVVVTDEVGFTVLYVGLGPNAVVHKKRVTDAPELWTSQQVKRKKKNNGQAYTQSSLHSFFQLAEPTTFVPSCWNG